MHVCVLLESGKPGSKILEWNLGMGQGSGVESGNEIAWNGMRFCVVEPGNEVLCNGAWE